MFDKSHNAMILCKFIFRERVIRFLVAMISAQFLVYFIQIEPIVWLQGITIFVFKTKFSTFFNVFFKFFQ